MDGLFAGLPAEFSPPEKAATRIADLSTRAEREAYWLTIPAPWRVMIGDFARLFIGMKICELTDLEARRKALEEVPAIWVDEVRWHVTRLWRTRDVRAEYQAELAAKRAAEKATA